MLVLYRQLLPNYHDRFYKQSTTVFTEILHMLSFCIAIFLQLDTIGVWSEKCRHQPTSKISQFWETHKVFRGIVKTVIFPWGIASITKKIINRIKPKKLDERAVESEGQQVTNSDPNDIIDANRYKLPERSLLRARIYPSFTYFCCKIRRLNDAGIATACLWLNDEQLETIMDNTELKVSAREIAYRMITMRTKLTICESKDLLEALENTTNDESNATTLENITTKKLDSDEKVKIKCDNYKNHAESFVFNVKNDNFEQQKNVTFWGKSNTINPALLRLMIVTELRTNPDRHEFYKKIEIKLRISQQQLS